MIQNSLRGSILVGKKPDLHLSDPSDNYIPPEEAQNYAEHLSYTPMPQRELIIPYIEISALNNNNVDEPFAQLVTILLDYIPHML